VPLAGARVLVPRAEGGRDEAIAALAAAGAAVDAVIAYRTVAVAPDDVAVAAGRGAIARGEAAVCAVFAPSQVAALRAIVGPGALRAQRYAAIGGTTAAALRASGVPAGAIRAAITPTPEGIATAVAAVYPPRS
jgi:uroporphyrinogen-III synthase